MKHQFLLLTLFSLLFVSTVPAQTGTTPLLCDDFSNPGLWQALGTKIFTWGLPGDITVNGGVAEFSEFRGRQSYRLARSMNGAIANRNTWRLEFDYIHQTVTTLSGVIPVSLTSDNQHPISATSGSTTPTNNKALYLNLANPLSSPGPSGDNLSVIAKNGTAGSVQSPLIPLTRNVQYYIRLERLNAQDLSLSLFTDANRSVHAPGSPVCLSIDPSIGGFDFLQMGTGTTASPSRRATGILDNLCIYEDVFNRSCNTTSGCDIKASVQYTTDGGCYFQFYNNSTAGPGNSLAPFSIITFGDGTSAQLAPGQTISHTYTFGGGYEVCITTKGYDADLNCCEDVTCIYIEANCGFWGKMGNADPSALDQVELFPNPANGNVTLRSTDLIQNVDVFDATGRLVKQVNAAGQEINLDILDLESGVYILHIGLEGNRAVKRKLTVN